MAVFRQHAEAYCPSIVLSLSLLLIVTPDAGEKVTAEFEKARRPEWLGNQLGIVRFCVANDATNTLEGLFLSEFYHPDSQMCHELNMLNENNEKFWNM